MQSDHAFLLIHCTNLFNFNDQGGCVGSAQNVLCRVDTGEDQFGSRLSSPAPLSTLGYPPQLFLEKYGSANPEEVMNLRAFRFLVRTLYLRRPRRTRRHIWDDRGSRAPAEAWCLLHLKHCRTVSHPPGHPLVPLPLTEAGYLPVGRRSDNRTQKSVAVDD